MLEDRRRELRRGLEPAPKVAIRAVALLLIAAGPQYGATPQQAALRAGLYAEALADLPLWAIDRARKTFSRGGWTCGWNGRGTPSTAEVAVEVRSYLAPIWVELRRIEAVLAAVPIATPTSEELEAATAERRRLVQALQEEDRRREAASRASVAADLEERRKRRESGITEGVARCF